MSSTRSRAILAIASSALFLCAAAASAEVHVTIGFEPIEVSRSGDAQTPAETGAFQRAAVSPDGDRGMMAVGDLWYINYFQADLSQAADATLWAVRNESEAPVQVGVFYIPTDAFATSQAEVAEFFTIPVNGVQTRNVRDVEGLTADPDGFARGHIRVQATAAVSVDFFQLIASEDFATGDTASHESEDICDDLSFRFIDFGGDRGSVATFLIGTPRGADPGDPPTLVGAVLGEDGNFINNFLVRTDEYSFQLDIRSFVLPGTLFGSIEISASPADGTIATITHRAGGRFSVSNAVFCRDPDTPILL